MPAGCVTCVTNLGEPDAGADCRAGAADAGLALSDCTDRSGAALSVYYCPAGTTATRGCGCSAVDAPFALGLLVLLRRRRRNVTSAG